MKNLILSLMMLAGVSSLAQADTVFDCFKPGNLRGVILEVTVDGWFLVDSDVKKGQPQKIKPARETQKQIQIYVDFGSGFEKRSYFFEGIQKCGIVSSDKKVIKMSKSLVSFSGTARQPEAQM